MPSRVSFRQRSTRRLRRLGNRPGSDEQSSNLGGYVATAIILRCIRKVRGAEDRVWYEYAPIIDGEARRRPTHMMGSVESASELARKSGFTVDPDVLDVRVP